MSAADVVSGPFGEESVWSGDHLKSHLPLSSSESILIYLTLGGSVIPMRVLESDSIGSLKLRIQTDKGFVVKKQKLVFAGRELARNDSLLKDYGVSSGNSLHLVVKLSDVILITVDTDCGRECEFHVDRHRNVGYIKRRIAKKGDGFTNPEDQEELLYNGEKLDDETFIDDVCELFDAAIHFVVQKSDKVSTKPNEGDVEFSIVAEDWNESPDETLDEEKSQSKELQAVPREQEDRNNFLETVIVKPIITLLSSTWHMIHSVLDGLVSSGAPIRSSEDWNESPDETLDEKKSQSKELQAVPREQEDRNNFLETVIVKPIITLLSSTWHIIHSVPDGLVSGGAPIRSSEDWNESPDETLDEKKSQSKELQAVPTEQEDRNIFLETVIVNPMITLLSSTWHMIHSVLDGLVSSKAPIRSSEDWNESPDETQNEKKSQSKELQAVPREQEDRNIFLEPVIVNPMITLLSSTWHMIHSVQDGLVSGRAPIQSSEGTGGTYLMQDESGNEYVAIFKPMDEEPMAINNPRGLPLSSNGEGLKRGTKVGEGALREVAAYLLDHPKTGPRWSSVGEVGFSGVPPTIMVHCMHEGFNHPEGFDCSYNNIKVGSLQVFMNNCGSCEDIGPQDFPVEEVHKISVLDIRTANADRHAGNILVSRNGNQGRITLIPIDHGYCLPENFEDCTFDWLYWPQSRQPYTQESLEYIKSLDAESDLKLLQFNGWDVPVECARVLRISTMLLKKGAKIGMTAFAIGSIMCRETLNKKSMIEEIVHEAEDSMLPGMNEAAFLETVSKIMDIQLDKLMKAAAS